MMHKYSDTASAAKHDLLSVSHLTREGFVGLLGLSRDLRSREMFADALRRKTVALIFEKPSLRTRVTFEIAVHQLGGWPVLVSEGKLGERESIPDMARSLSQWVDAIVARVYSHRALEELALFSPVPVVNALSDYEHPCQAIADILTLLEVWPGFHNKELVYIGDWNNVSRSLGRACGLVDLRFRAICPEGYGPPEEEGVDWTADTDAVKGADAVYADVWASMGQEHELARRLEIFKPYQVNEKLLVKTGKRTLFMHCLPAHRGQEVVDLVIESGDSLVFRQAANRLPVEKAVLFSLLENHHHEASEEGRAGLFRRPGYIDHHTLAQGKLWV